MRLILVAVFLLLPSCSRSGPDPASATGLMTRLSRLASEGSIDVNPSTPPRAAVWRVVEDVAIGGPVADQGYEFGHVAGAAFDHQDRIYVYDGLTKEIALFDEDGDLVRRFAGKGEGPGEFTGLLVAITYGPGDSLRVFDAALWREAVFDSLGSVLRVSAFPPPQGMGQEPERQYDAGGYLYNLGYDGFVTSLDMALGRSSAGVTRGEVTIDAWSPADRSWTTLIAVPSIAVYFQGGALDDAPFAPRPLWSVTPSDGLWYADSGTYSLIRLGHDGQPIRHVRVNTPAPVVSDDDRDAYREARDLVGQREDWRNRVAQDRERLPLPAYRPALEAIVAADDGGVWVRAAAPRWLATADTVSWDVFGVDGSLLARVSLPASFDPRLG